MHSSPVPWQVLSSHLGVGIFSEGWTLNVCEDEAEEVRHFCVNIVFASAFTAVPVVHLGLTGFDTDQRDSSRLTLKAENITPSGFSAVISTWAASRVYAVEFDWLAIGS